MLWRLSLTCSNQFTRSNKPYLFLLRLVHGIARESRFRNIQQRKRPPGGVDSRSNKAQTKSPGLRREKQIGDDDDDDYSVRNNKRTVGLFHGEVCSRAYVHPSIHVHVTEWVTEPLLREIERERERELTLATSSVNLYCAMTVVKEQDVWEVGRGSNGFGRLQSL